MKSVFEQLKSNAAGKTKEYGAPINSAEMLFAGDLLCSYVVENGLVRQGVFTVSHKDKGEFVVPEDFENDVKSVFGPASMVWKRSYPNRGVCRQYVFPTT